MAKLQAILRMVYVRLVICEFMRAALDREVVTVDLCDILPEFLIEAGAPHFWPFQPKHATPSSSQGEEAADKLLEANLGGLYANLVALARIYESKDRDRTALPDHKYGHSWGVMMQRVMDVALPLLRRAAHLIKAVRGHFSLFWKARTIVRVGSCKMGILLRRNDTYD